jgi:hypothetical protein
MRGTPRTEVARRPHPSTLARRAKLRRELPPLLPDMQLASVAPNVARDSSNPSLWHVPLARDQERNRTWLDLPRLLPSSKEPQSQAARTHTQGGCGRARHPASLRRQAIWSSRRPRRESLSLVTPTPSHRLACASRQHLPSSTGALFALGPEWGPAKPTARGGGTRWPGPNPGQQVRVMPGDPGGDDPLHRGPYVVISPGEPNDGPYRVPLERNPALDP